MHYLWDGHFKLKLIKSGEFNQIDSIRVGLYFLISLARLQIVKSQLSESRIEISLTNLNPIELIKSKKYKKNATCIILIAHYTM